MMIVLIGGVMFASSNGQSLLLPGRGQILMGRHLTMITLSLCHYHQMAKPWLSAIGHNSSKRPNFLIY